MRISAISNNQKNPNFNASLKVIESGAAKKLLSEKTVDTLAKKLKPIGKETDSLTVYLTQYLSKEDSLIASFENDYPNFCTKISIVDDFEGTRFTPFPVSFATVYGNVADRTMKTVKLLEYHIEKIGKLINK